jgi:hypothetical protein
MQDNSNDHYNEKDKDPQEAGLEIGHLEEFARIHA